MSGSLNKVILIGNLGQDPEIKTFQSGHRICNLSIATSETWKDKTTGEKRERTQWHRVVITNKPTVGVAEKYLQKGDKVYIEGRLETRSWEQDGQKKYVTEIIVAPFSGVLTMLTTKNSGGVNASQSEDNYSHDFRDDAPPPSGDQPPPEEYESDIPF